MQEKKIPMRHCVGCGTEKPKKELVRVVRTPEGAILLDLTGKTSGRGAYLCRALPCLKKARKAKRLESQLGVPIPDEVYDRLESEMSGNE